MIEPIDAPVSQEWGLTRFARDNPHVYGGQGGHCGRDYACPDGTAVRAPEDGEIVHVGEYPPRRSLGYYIVLVSKDGKRRHRLTHLTPRSAAVERGGAVRAAQDLALSGHSPRWAPHLHWEIEADGPEALRKTIDPRALLHPDRYANAALRGYARAAAERAGIDPAIFARQIERESRWDVHAHSPAGAVGIAQIVPRWHPTVNPWDAHAALDYAAALMASHLGVFGSYELALAAYNAGPNAVRRHGGVPPFGETRNYVNSILDERRVRPVSERAHSTEPVLSLPKRSGQADGAPGIFDDTDLWLKASWEELAQKAIQVVNRAGAGMTPTDDESRFLNHRYKDLIENWPRLMEAERLRAAREPLRQAQGRLLRQAPGGARG